MLRSPRSSVVIVVFAALLGLALRLEAATTTTWTVEVGATLSPEAVVVELGNSVMFQVVDGQTHRLVADNGEFDTGMLSPGDTFTWTVAAPPAQGREYGYVDTQTLMRGRICVKWCNDAVFYQFVPFVVNP